MSINTIMHISDEANTVTLKPNKVYGPKVTNYQIFIGRLNDKMFTGEVEATTSTYGIGKLSDKVIDDNNLVTVKSFSEVKFDAKATETKFGRTKMSTPKDSIVFSKRGNDTINPKTAKYFIDEFVATENDYGYIKLVPNTLLRNYSKRDVVVTTDNLSYSMDYMIPKLGKATVSNSGIVKIATTQEAKAGKLHNGVVISPKKFHSVIATTTQYGLAKISTQQEVDSFKSGTLLASKHMEKYKKMFSDNNKKLDKLDSEMAKANNSRERYITDEINKIIGNYSDSSLRNYVRVGDVVYSLRRNNIGLGDYAIPTGQFLDSVVYKELFDVIGYKYGKSGSKFKLPDLRGLYFRNDGLGTSITTHEKYKNVSKDMEIPVLGEVQRQMISKHKHGGNWNDQSKWGSSFGHTGNWGWYGSGGEQWGCHSQYHTDGGEIISDGGIKDYPNPEGMINEDKETRPWSMAVNIYMRIK